MRCSDGGGEDMCRFSEPISSLILIHSPLLLLWPTSSSSHSLTDKKEMRKRKKSDKAFE